MTRYKGPWGHSLSSGEAGRRAVDSVTGSNVLDKYTSVYKYAEGGYIDDPEPEPFTTQQDATYVGQNIEDEEVLKSIVSRVKSNNGDNLSHEENIFLQRFVDMYGEDALPDQIRLEDLPYGGGLHVNNLNRTYGENHPDESAIFLDSNRTRESTNTYIRDEDRFEYPKLLSHELAHRLQHLPLNNPNRPRRSHSIRRDDLSRSNSPNEPTISRKEVEADLLSQVMLEGAKNDQNTNFIDYIHQQDANRDIPVEDLLEDYRKQVPQTNYQSTIQDQANTLPNLYKNQRANGGYTNSYKSIIEKYSKGGFIGDNPQPNKEQPIVNTEESYFDNIKQTYGDHTRTDYFEHLNQADARNQLLQASEKVNVDPNVLSVIAFNEGFDHTIWNYHNDADGDYEDAHQGQISGFSRLGLDHFYDRYSTLKEQQYLPEDFTEEDFTKLATQNEKQERVNSANFVNTQKALEALGAEIKYAEDQLQDYIDQKEYDISEEDRLFFTNVAYNAGIGNARKMLDSYISDGILEDDSYFREQPTEYWEQPYNFARRRFQTQQAFRNENVFPESEISFFKYVPEDQKLDIDTVEAQPTRQLNTESIIEKYAQ